MEKETRACPVCAKNDWIMPVQDDYYVCKRCYTKILKQMMKFRSTLDDAMGQLKLEQCNNGVLQSIINMLDSKIKVNEGRTGQHG